MKESTMQLLAAAIVERAIDDWHKAGALLVGNPDYHYAIEIKQEIEEFFESQWFEFLCDIHPDLTKVHLQEMRV